MATWQELAESTDRILALTAELKTLREAREERRAMEPRHSLAELRAGAVAMSLPKNVAMLDQMIAKRLGGLSVVPD